MGTPLKVGDRVRFAAGGEDLIMTVASAPAEYDFVNLEYTVDGTVRHLGIVAGALVLVDDTGRSEAESCP